MPESHSSSRLHSSQGGLEARTIRHNLPRQSDHRTHLNSPPWPDHPSKSQAHRPQFQSRSLPRIQSTPDVVRVADRAPRLAATTGVGASPSVNTPWPTLFGPKTVPSNGGLRVYRAVGPERSTAQRGTYPGA